MRAVFKSHIDFFSSFLCILKPFSSVIPKRIFLNLRLLCFLAFVQITVSPTFYLIEQISVKPIILAGRHKC